LNRLKTALYLNYLNDGDTLGNIDCITKVICNVFLGNSSRIIVQGGAYRSMPSDKKEDYKRAT
jgi:hypothetical protein